MYLRYLAAFLCGAVAVLLVAQSHAVALPQADNRLAQAVQRLADQPLHAPETIRVAKRGQDRGGRHFRGDDRGGRHFRGDDRGRRQFRDHRQNRRSYRDHKDRRYGDRGRRYYRPGDRYYGYYPYFPYDYYYYYDYPYGGCAYWHSRCVRRWGYATPGYYGCMRYQGCL